MRKAAFDAKARSAGGWSLQKRGYIAGHVEGTERDLKRVYERGSGIRLGDKLIAEVVLREKGPTLFQLPTFVWTRDRPDRPVIPYPREVD